MSKYRHELITLRITHSQLRPCLVHEKIMLVVSSLMTADSRKNHFINVSFLGLDQASDSGKNVSFLGTNEAFVINITVSVTLVSSHCKQWKAAAAAAPIVIMTPTYPQVNTPFKITCS